MSLTLYEIIYMSNWLKWIHTIEFLKAKYWITKTQVKQYREVKITLYIAFCRVTSSIIPVRRFLCQCTRVVHSILKVMARFGAIILNTKHGFLSQKFDRTYNLRGKEQRWLVIIFSTRETAAAVMFYDKLASNERNLLSITWWKYFLGLWLQRGIL